MAKVVIPLFYHLDRRIWTDSLTATTELTQIEIGQSNNIDFAVRFCNAGVATQLTSPSPVWICAIKAINDFAGLNLLLTTTGVLVGTGANSVYTFTLQISSAELSAWLLTVTGNTALASFEIRDTNNNIATLPALTCAILPDYTLVGTTPTSSAGTLVVASGKTFTVSQTLAMPTDNGTAGFVLRTDGAGVGSWVANTTGSVTSVGQSFTGGIVQVSGTPVTSTGTLALTVLGTQGGIVYFSSSSGWASTSSLSVGGLVMGGGTSMPTVLSATSSGRVLTSQGVNISPAYSSTITLGASGTLGTITLGNAMSGTILITPPTGALGTVTLTLPIVASTNTLAGLSGAQTFDGAKTFSQILAVTSATESVSASTGALIVTGGIGVAATRDATSSSLGGAMTIAGGLAVAKKAFIGTLLDLVATTATAGQITQGGERFIHTFQPSGQNQNVFIGFQAGRTSTMSGGGNVGIGRAVLQGLTSGGNNLCFGDGVAYAMTSGSSNVIIGQASGNTLSTGNNNTAAGVNSLKSGNTTGCVALGYNSLRDTLSNSNVALGFNAGYSITGTAGNNGYNTCIGDSAGTATSLVGGLTGSAMLTGTSNTMLGAKTSATSASGIYRTAIGCDSICESNNAIKLGRDTLDVVLLPKMTEAQLATAATTLSTVKGAIAYCTDGAHADHVFFYNGSVWAKIN